MVSLLTLLSIFYAFNLLFPRFSYRSKTVPLKEMLQKQIEKKAESPEASTDSLNLSSETIQSWKDCEQVVSSEQNLYRLLFHFFFFSGVRLDSKSADIRKSDWLWFDADISCTVAMCTRTCTLVVCCERSAVLEAKHESDSKCSGFQVVLLGLQDDGSYSRDFHCHEFSWPLAETHSYSARQHNAWTRLFLENSDCSYPNLEIQFE